MEYYSPAFSVTSDMTDEELDKYFETYVPLSRLPTPPPAKDHAISRAASTSTTAPAPELTAYATHLANLVPSCTPHRPHVDVVSGFLDRANLPDEVVAFAAVVLGRLSGRFVEDWREELRPAAFQRDLQSFLYHDSTSSSHTNISSDIIVLAALALAHGYLIDRLRSSRHWSVKESAGTFSVSEIEATKRAILRDCEYGLFKIQEEDVMSMCGELKKMKAVTPLVKHDRKRTLSISLKGTAIWSYGVQTPEPSP